MTEQRDFRNDLDDVENAVYDREDEHAGYVTKIVMEMADEIDTLRAENRSYKDIFEHHICYRKEDVEGLKIDTLRARIKELEKRPSCLESEAFLLD
jgi:hypothetical protein